MQVFLALSHSQIVCNVMFLVHVEFEQKVNQNQANK